MSWHYETRELSPSTWIDFEKLFEKHGGVQGGCWCMFYHVARGWRDKSRGQNKTEKHAYWLFKTEPETFSWAMQKKKGAKGEPWSGVRNHTAKQNMKEMKKGDLGFFYHTGDEKAVVGIVEVIGEYRPDPTDEKGIFGLVDVKAVKDFPKPVSLADCKANPKLKNMSLVKSFRLSVQPVTAEEWKIVCAMGGLKA